MDWDDLQKKALADGNLVYAMDQGQTEPLTQPGPWGSSDGGYCGGLTMRWIALHYIGQEYPYDAQTKEAIGYSWQATRDQTQYYDSTKSFPEDFRIVATHYGLTVNKGSLKTSLPISGRIVALAANDFRGCCLVFLRRSGGGHFVGVGRNPEYKSGFYVFDPNYGSFKLAGLNETVDFLEWFLAASKYKERYSSISLVGVNAPPFVLADLKEMAKAGWGFT